MKRVFIECLLSILDTSEYSGLSKQYKSNKTPNLKNLRIGKSWADLALLFFLSVITGNWLGQHYHKKKKKLHYSEKHKCALYNNSSKYCYNYVITFLNRNKYWLRRYLRKQQHQTLKNLNLDPIQKFRFEYEFYMQLGLPNVEKLGHFFWFV